jgi:hypothetical protein
MSAFDLLFSIPVQVSSFPFRFAQEPQSDLYDRHAGFLLSVSMK